MNKSTIGRDSTVRCVLLVSASAAMVSASKRLPLPLHSVGAVTEDMVISCSTCSGTVIAPGVRVARRALLIFGNMTDRPSVQWGVRRCSSSSSIRMIVGRRSGQVCPRVGTRL